MVRPKRFVSGIAAHPNRFALGVVVASCVAATSFALGCGSGTASDPASDAGPATETDAASDAASDVDPTPPDDGATDPSDASPDPDAPSDGSTPTSRCSATADTVTCTSHEITIDVSSIGRRVTYEVPEGTPPAGGWPTVLYFQGSLVPGHTAFQAKLADPFGMFQLTLTIKELLDRGYAVISPDALSDGKTYWQTNIPPWSTNWTSSTDHAFVLSIFDEIAKGSFGPLDASRLYAMGISSGGFMTSRMAMNYAGKFRALAVHSAGYATCSASVAACSMPTPLPSDHPPTLFLHGQKDKTVPVGVMEMYRDELAKEGRTVDTVLDPNAGHEWLASGPTKIGDWFDTH